MTGNLWMDGSMLAGLVLAVGVALHWIEKRWAK